MERDTFRPGEMAPESGVYRVVHHAHRLPHDVTIEKGTAFPACVRCDARARFVFLQAAPFVRDDYDFGAPQKRVVNGN